MATNTTHATSQASVSESNRSRIVKHLYHNGISSRTGEVSTLDTPHVEVNDTVGAGDSFSGTFTARILLGDTQAEAHRKAVNTAAYVCTQAGAWPQYPAEMPDYLAEIGK